MEECCHVSSSNVDVGAELLSVWGWGPRRIPFTGKALSTLDPPSSLTKLHVCEGTAGAFFCMRAGAIVACWPTTTVITSAPRETGRPRPWAWRLARGGPARRSPVLERRPLGQHRHRAVARLPAEGGAAGGLPRASRRGRRRVRPLAGVGLAAAASRSSWSSPARRGASVGASFARLSLASPTTGSRPSTTRSRWRSGRATASTTSTTS